MNLSAPALSVLTFFACTVGFHAQELPPNGASLGSVEAGAANSGNAQNVPSSTASLPGAPEPQNRALPQESEGSKISASGNLPAVLAPQMTPQRLEVGDKFALYVHQAFGPFALLPPVLGMAISMAHPADRYPHDWRAGGGAMGRLSGDFAARWQSGQAGRFAAEATFREDPRYQPATSHSASARISHALFFTLVDQSDSGHRMPALSNFVGAAASGFVGNAYLPRGYNDVTHAGQRSALAFGGFAAGNLANEFCPEWGPMVNKLHIPFVHPPCLNRMRSKDQN